MEKVTINVETPWILEGKYDPEKEFWSSSKIIDHVICNLVLASPDFNKTILLPENQITKVSDSEYSTIFQKTIFAWSEYRSLIHIVINGKRWAVGVGSGSSNLVKVASNGILDIIALPVEVGENGIDPYDEFYVDLMTNHNYRKSLLIAFDDGSFGSSRWNVSRWSHRLEPICEFIENGLDEFTVYAKKDDPDFVWAQKFKSVPMYKPELADKLSELMICALSYR